MNRNEPCYCRIALVAFFVHGPSNLWVHRSWFMNRCVDSAGSNWSGWLASPFRQYWVPEYYQWHSPVQMDPLSSWPKVETSTSWYDRRCWQVNVASICTLVCHSQIIDTRRPRRRSTRTNFIFISCKASSRTIFEWQECRSNISMKDKRSIDWSICTLLLSLKRSR